ncbi:MAG: hypothetical protein HUU32_07090 [Calditrichaceae bacterium]|nr:hypothetical protein [Calditrichia bacterium]NUQ41144.1 hypothetical protein [Calditrichaceae bacterium]
MEDKVQFLLDHSGKKVGVYLPIETWETLLQGDTKILEKFRRGRKKKSNLRQELPSFDLGGDFMPTREEIYDEHILREP